MPDPSSHLPPLYTPTVNLHTNSTPRNSQGCLTSHKPGPSMPGPCVRGRPHRPPHQASHNLFCRAARFRTHLAVEMKCVRAGEFIEHSNHGIAVAETHQKRQDLPPGKAGVHFILPPQILCHLLACGGIHYQAGGAARGLRLWTETPSSG